jgi:uncharacterized tellurite resistance protein B-like protein
MRTEDFQNLLLESAISVMGCDGSINESEIHEIRQIAENEIYFMGFEYEPVFKSHLKSLKANGSKAINDFLNRLEGLSLNKQQEFLLLEVLIRTIESDQVIDDNEIKFLQLVKSKLNVSEEEIITKFPEQLAYLIDFKNYSELESFNSNITFKEE